jgi:uncharacterized DUF497 family protein
MTFRFEWDRRKAASNLRQHAVSFAEATNEREDYEEGVTS